MGAQNVGEVAYWRKTSSLSVLSPNRKQEVSDQQEFKIGVLAVSNMQLHTTRLPARGVTCFVHSADGTTKLLSSKDAYGGVS